MQSYKQLAKDLIMILKPDLKDAVKKKKSFNLVLIFPFSLSTCQLQCNKCNVPLIPTYFSQKYIKDITHNPWENKWLNCHRTYVKFEHYKCEMERETHRENVCQAKNVCVF